MSERKLLTSESVTEGHPDKVCDQISDGVLDAILSQDRMSRVACETAITNGLVLVMGEITTSAYVDIQSIVRETIRSIGYTSSDIGFDASTCGVITSISEQSPDIAQGVGRGNELETGAGGPGHDDRVRLPRDAGMMPLTISLAHRLTRRLAESRKSGELWWLRPDGKSQVTIEYDEHYQPRRIEAVVISTQHHPEVSASVIQY